LKVLKFVPFAIYGKINMKYASDVVLEKFDIPSI